MTDLADSIAAALEVGRRRLAGASDLDSFLEARQEVLGKRSAIAQLNTRLGGLDPDQRRDAGAAINGARRTLADEADALQEKWEARRREDRVAAERLDLTEITSGPAGPPLEWSGRGAGHLHLVTQTRDELEDTFVAMGFTVAEGPEAENDWYNFEALNMPPDHPARGMWDTLYLRLGQPGSVLLRTHTSPVQVRLMEAGRLPIYAVMPGRCYRRDTPDARHLAVFHQIEGLVVDKGITFGDMAGVIDAFTAAFFGEGMHARLRPSFFPFTEPSAEFEVTCPICAGAGCRTCSGSGWIELGGCGMVDPNVFASVGIDPEVYTGFAFGFGIDRLAQVRSALPDMRALLDNDVRFLSQF
ncbi:MAG TPA: phenylalanine--tRNA ligase subunit alpha [Acidimicrobiales bacterium]|jgi:phenylalanyl-tRNA synthetase alpha chain|nr:phenylalanine--tRNA ligase subunit alpha [Acidimicrobiales bacterium]